MRRMIVLDTNIVFNMINSNACFVETMDVLGGYEILVTDLTVYELNNNKKDISKLLKKGNVELCRIRCLGKGLSLEENEKLKADILSFGKISKSLEKIMRKNYIYMIKPIVCVWFIGYVGMICPALRNDLFHLIRKDLYSKKNVKKVSKNMKDILYEVNPKEFKYKFYNKVKRFWKYYVYKYGLNDNSKFDEVKKIINCEQMNQIFFMNLNKKKDNEIFDIFEMDFDNNQFPIIKKHYNGIIANYFKILYMKCITEKSVIDINHLIDSLIISILQHDVILCTDDKKMNNFLKYYNRYDSICDEVINIKEKYDMM